MVTNAAQYVWHVYSIIKSNTKVKLKNKNTTNIQVGQLIADGPRDVHVIITLYRH